MKQMKQTKFSVILLAVALMLGVSFSANAQLKFGIRGEVGVNEPSLKKDDYKVENMNAFKIGPTVEFMIPLAGFGLDGSLLYSNEKMKVKNIDDGGTDNLLKEISSHYIDVPVNLKYKIGVIAPLKIYLAAGPYAQIKVGGDDFKIDDISTQVEDKNFQAGMNFGFGVDLIHRVQVGFNYRKKMTDNYSVDEPEWKDLLNDNKGFWSMTASVYF